MPTWVNLFGPAFGDKLAGYTIVNIVHGTQRRNITKHLPTPYKGAFLDPPQGLFPEVSESATVQSSSEPTKSEKYAPEHLQHTRKFKSAAHIKIAEPVPSTSQLTSLASLPSYQQPTSMREEISMKLVSTRSGSKIDAIRNSKRKTALTPASPTKTSPRSKSKKQQKHKGSHAGRADDAAADADEEIEKRLRKKQKKKHGM